MNKYIILGIILLVVIVCIFFYYTISSKKNDDIQNLLQMKPIIYTHEPFSNKITPDDFIPSDTFQGSKEGYVFKKDNKGLGYYIDKNM